jgi:hypothetical protein
MLGQVSKMTKAQAQAELAAIVAPINSSCKEPSEQTSFDDFVQHVFLPFYRRKWKRSTAMTNEDRLARYLTSELGPVPWEASGGMSCRHCLITKAERFPSTWSIICAGI